MTKIFAFIFLGLVVLTGLGGSCRKGDDPKPCESMITAPKEFLDFWYFPRESYWVYKLDTTIDIYDTVTNSSFLEEENYGAHSGHSCVTLYQTALFHSNRKFFPYTDTTLTTEKGAEILSSRYGSNSTAWGVSENSQTGTVYSPGFLFLFPFTMGHKVEVTTLETLDSFTTPAGTFDSTLSLTSSVNQSDLAGPNYKHFKQMRIAKGAGIVETVYTNGEKWTLVDYAIKP